MRNQVSKIKIQVAKIVFNCIENGYIYYCKVVLLKVFFSNCKKTISRRNK